MRGRGASNLACEEPSERARIERVYRAYTSDPHYRRIWTGDAARFIIERKWKEIRKTLAAEALDLSALRLLDLGSGGGVECERFRALGVRPENIVALDLLQEYSQAARAALPWLASVQGDAAILPFRESAFDVVYQSTMLSSVLDQERRAGILEQVRRVLAPGGLFLSYDTRYPNPWNPNTRPVPASEMRAALPEFRFRVRSLTPIPHLVRFLRFLPSPVWKAVEWVPAFRSHLLIAARKL